MREFASWSIILGNILHSRGWSQQRSTTLTGYPGTSPVSLIHRSKLNPSNSTIFSDGPCKNIHLCHHIPQFNVWHYTLWRWRTAPRWQCSQLPMSCCFFLWTDGWAGATGEKSKALFMRMYHATTDASGAIHQMILVDELAIYLARHTLHTSLKLQGWCKAQLFSCRSNWKDIDTKQML